MCLQVPAIVMLTNVSECGVNKCAQYYPVQEGGKVRLAGFKLQVGSHVAGSIVLLMPAQTTGLMDVGWRRVALQPLSPDRTLRQG